MSASPNGLPNQQPLEPRDSRSLGYIIELADKHDVDPHKLLRSFLDTERKGTVSCGPLNITVRKRAKDYAVFLITRGKEILAQMRIKGNIWASPSHTKSLFSILVDRDRSSGHYPWR